MAAGKGTRMKSDRPKVLHEVAGRPMLARVLDVARAAGCERIFVVVGHGADAVRAAFPDPDLVWVEQREQRGTGHALAQVASSCDRAATLLVLSGDVPCLSAETLAELALRAESGWGSMAVAELDSPGALGRVRTGPHGTLAGIVEAADASPEELAIRTVNAGIYALPAPEIFTFLDALSPDNAKRELYLTDALTAAARAGRRIALVPLADPDEALGVNDRVDLARAHVVLLARSARRLALAGVTVLDPSRTAIEPEVEVGPDTVIHPGAQLAGRTRVGRGATIGAGAVLVDCAVADGATVLPYTVAERARIGAGARVGPFARLRPGADLGPEARVGNFVEVKNSTLGRGAKANHLAYLGDATVGEGANIGAGAVTCNYDGVEKHRTEIGARAFVGSDTMLVAPVRVGDDATTGAGSVVTRDVPDGALAVERSPQRTVEGWAARRRGRRTQDESKE